MRTLGAALVLGITAMLAPSLATAQEWEEVALYGAWTNDLFADTQNRVWAAASRGGVYRLANGGTEWVRVFDDPDIDPRSVAVGTGGRAYIGTDGFLNTGFIRTTNDGASWQVISNSLSGEIVRDILPMPDNQTIWACTFDNGLYRSTNGGTSFSSVASFPASFPLFIRANAAGHLFVGAQLAPVNLYFSSDGGASWQARDSGLAGDAQSLFVDATTGDLYVADGTNVFESTNNGLNWTSLAAPPGVYLAVALFQGRIYAAQYAGTATGARVYSNEVGAAALRANWVLEAGVPVQSFSGLCSTNDGLFLGSVGPGPYRRDANGWQQMTVGMRNVFIDGIVTDEINDVSFLAAQNIGILRSSNGAEWGLVGNGIPRTDLIYSMVVAPNGNLFASSASTGIYMSTDEGENFTSVFSQPVTALAANDWGYILGGSGNRIYRSSNGGMTWPQVATLTGVNGISDIECTGNDVYVATGYFDFGGQGVHRSTNWGSSFAPFNSGLGNLTVRDLAIDPDVGTGPCEITAATSTGLYDLNGVSWSLNASYGFGDVKKVFKSLDRRVALEETSIRYSSPQTCVYDIFPEPDPTRYYGEFAGIRIAGGAFRGGDTYVDLLGTFGDGLYRRSGSSSTSATDLPAAAAGVRFDVRRNPFVRSTTLELEMPQAGAAQVAIYDAAGRKMTSLMDGWTAAGRHSLDWDASGLAAGVYFARLITGSESRTQRLVLLR